MTPSGHTNTEKKFCQACGTEASSPATYCIKCGTRLYSGSEAPQYSRIQPLWQFVVLSIVSLGIYDIYWIYKKWKFIKQTDKTKISPFWRTAFLYLFLHGLFTKIFTLAANKGYKEKNHPCLLALAYIMMFNLPNVYWGLAVLSFLPLIPAIKALNYYFKKQDSLLPIRTRFSKGEIIFLIICCLLFTIPRIGVLPKKSTVVNKMTVQASPLRCLAE